MARGRRKRRPFALPPELQGLAPRILENGEVDLGISREALLRFLESVREAEKRDEFLNTAGSDTQDPQTP